MKLSTRQWRHNDLLIATGKTNTRRPGSGVYKRFEYVLEAARKGLNFGQYEEEYVEKELTKATTLRNAVLEGLIKPVTDDVTNDVSALPDFAAAANHAVLLAVRQVGEQLVAYADQRLASLGDSPERIIATGKPNPYKRGTSPYWRAEQILRWAAESGTVGDFCRRHVRPDLAESTNRIRLSALRDAIRTGLILPVTVPELGS